MDSPACSTCGAPFPEGATECPFDGTPLAAAVTGPGEDPLVGREVGEYRIEARLGTGGMGIVYRGTQPLIGKRVAIKVLRPDIASDRLQVQRLLDEAKAVNAIRHRGIIDIFGFGHLPDGRNYIVMEELEGEPLDVLLKRDAPVPPSTVLELLDEVLSALAAAHLCGVIHRDLKPSNLFVVRQPGGSKFVKLLDFGLAKRAVKPGARVDQTSILFVTGTPEYMAPEQARAEPVGPETDLYAIGVIAFEMLTGQVPFEGATAIDVLTRALSNPAPRPSAMVATVPESVDEVILRLLEKDRAKRPHSAEAVRLELSRIGRALQAASTVVRDRPTPGALGAGATQVVPNRLRPDAESGSASPVAESAPSGLADAASTPASREVERSTAALQPVQGPARTRQLAVIAVGLAVLLVSALAVGRWRQSPRGEPVPRDRDPAVEQPSSASPERPRSPEPRPNPAPPNAVVGEVPVVPTPQPHEPPRSPSGPSASKPNSARAVAAGTPHVRIQVVADDCEPDADWKRSARMTLEELTRHAAKAGPELALWASDEEAAISPAIASASTKGDCSFVDKRLTAFAEKLKAR